MNRKEETILISLGSTANLISGHLLNLQGLAATTDTVDAHVTHAVHQEFHVPRCLFVEEGESLRFCDAVESTPLSKEVSSLVFPSSVSTTIYQNAARALAYSPHSRYRVPKSYAMMERMDTLSNSSGRHVNWNDEIEDSINRNHEFGEENEEEHEDQVKRQKREAVQWLKETMPPLQALLENHWDSLATLSSETEQNQIPNELQPKTDKHSQAQTPSSTDTTHPHLDYMSFFAPPFPVNYRCILPFSKQSYIVETWDSYLTPTSSKSARDWKEGDLFEKLRKILEKSDGIQGVTLATEGHGIFAGFTTALLRELKDECRTAARLVLHVTDPATTPPTFSHADDLGKSAHVRAVRTNVESGLALHDWGDTAHAILPLELGSPLAPRELFQHTSQIAMALETATLAYRSKSPLMATGYMGNVSSRIAMREFIAMMQPMETYKLLELDFYADSYQALSLLTGTSVERRDLQQQNRESYRCLDPPGKWIQSSLTTLSPNPSSSGLTNVRSMHHHWSLATSMRSAHSTQGGRNDLTCIMEGMGIRYRPESSLGVVTHHDFKTLVSDGYAAGAYWRRAEELDPTVVAVLSNSTRSYNYAKMIANNMKDTLTMSKYKGYYNRDIARGTLPEREDSLEAMEYCLGLRDSYCPPDGSGLGDDMEGNYFDE